LGEAWIKAYDSQHEDNFSQAGDLFRLMSAAQKAQLVNNIAGGLKQASQLIQDKMLAQFYAADSEYAEMIKQALAN
jgi:catalase